MSKIRLDKLLVDMRFFESREKAVTCIMSNGVKIAGVLVNKPGHQINLENFNQHYESDPSYIEINDRMLEYVSRGDYKLKAAHEAFALDFREAMVFDIGASTGGFTDYALKQGASQVFAIDVGKGQLHYKLRNDSRVFSLEEFNFRDFALEDFANKIEKINFVVIDVSFISLLTILAKLQKLIEEDQNKSSGFFSPSLQIIALVKPQFEAGKEIMDKCQGVIKDSAIRDDVLDKVLKSVQGLGFKQQGLIESPIHGAKGNVEYLLSLV